MKLKDICKFVNEKVDTSSFHLEDYVSTENLLPNKGGVTVASKIPQGKATLFKKGDILISNIRPYFKKIYLAKKQGCCSNDVLCIRPNSNIPSSYLYYLLSQDSFFDYVMTGAKGTKMPRGDKGHIMNWAVYQSTLSQQQNIAEILTPLDDKIAVNSRICANLEAQAQALFKSWFVDFTPFKDQPFVDSELGSIPQGWKVGKLGDYCETICRGLTPKYNLDSKEIVLGQTCVRNNIVTLNNARKHQPKGKTEKKVQQWDTLINSTGIGSLGRVGIVYFDYNYVSFDSHITVVRATNPLLRPYIGRNLVSRQLEIENLAIGSTGQTELPRESVKSITLYIPTQKVLESFNCIIKPLSLKILKNIQENQRLAALRDTLLPKLMSGEIKL